MDQPLQRPEVHTFIAVAYPPNTKHEQQTIDAGDWVGSAMLLGPTPKTVYDIPESGGPEIGGDDVESKWQMCAVTIIRNTEGRELRSC
jgi:hypothetical protein